MADSIGRQGINTVSTTWITPLDWLTSAMVIIDVPPFASVIRQPLPARLSAILPPATVVRLSVPPLRAA